MEDKRWVGTCTQIYSGFILFSLTEIFPALAEGGTAAGQALSQLLAIIVTLAFAIVGGLVTGQLRAKCEIFRSSTSLLCSTL
jgi:hypothetical protein